MKELKDYFDKSAMLIHLDDDVSSRGGDASQRTCMLEVAMFSHNSFDERYFISRVLISLWQELNRNGEPTRHYGTPYWPSKPGHMSRDNLFGWICVGKLHNILSGMKIMSRIFLRGGFLWNTKKIGQQNGSWKIPDWCGPLMWFIAFRGSNYFFDWLADMYLWMAIRVRCYKASKDADDVGDDLNLCVAIETMRLIRDTKTLKKARRWYLENRPPTPFLNAENNVIGALSWYFRHDSAPPLDVIFEDRIRAW